MAVIVAEFHAACKIEAGEDHAFLAGQAGGGPEAEAARHHAVDGPVRRPAISTRSWVSESTVHLSSPCVAKMRFSPSNRMVTLVRKVLAAATFADAGDAEHQPDAVAVAARRARRC